MNGNTVYGYCFNSTDFLRTSVDRFFLFVFDAVITHKACGQIAAQIPTWKITPTNQAGVIVKGLLNLGHGQSREPR
jgi:hypothetical protein